MLWLHFDSNLVIIIVIINTEFYRDVSEIKNINTALNFFLSRWNFNDLKLIVIQMNPCWKTTHLRQCLLRRSIHSYQHRICKISVYSRQLGKLMTSKETERWHSLLRVPFNNHSELKNWEKSFFFAITV